MAYFCIKYRNIRTRENEELEYQEAATDEQAIQSLVDFLGHNEVQIVYVEELPETMYLAQKVANAKVIQERNNRIRWNNFVKNTAARPIPPQRPVE